MVLNIRRMITFLFIITAQIIGQIINNHGRSRLAHGTVQIEEY